MNFVSQIFFGIIITSFTGTITMLLWEFVKKIFYRRNLPFLYLALRFVCLFYVIPVGYVIVQLTVKDGYLQWDGFWQLNFMLTGIMKCLMGVLTLLWLVLTIRYLIVYSRGCRCWKKIQSSNIPEDRNAVLEEFRRIKGKLKIRRNIRVYRNSLLPGPMIMGVINPHILLPDCEYSEEQLAVIFYHELTHYKNCDLLFKLCSAYVGTVQHLNAPAERLLGLLHEWSECECDRKAITAMRDELTAGRYFELIMEMKENTPETSDEEHIFSMLCESQQRLERRIDYMKKYTEVKKVAKGVTAFMAFTFTMFSVTTAYAAGTELAEVHDYLYKNTESIAVEQDVAAEELEEFCLTASEDNSYSDVVYEETELKLITPLLEENEVVSFQWTVTPGVRHVSGKIRLKAGQKIVLSSVVTPADVTYWLGIMDDNGAVRCVEGTESMSHTFEIQKDDSYRVLVQNRGSKTLTAGGSYYYYTP